MVRHQLVGNPLIPHPLGDGHPKVIWVYKDESTVSHSWVDGERQKVRPYLDREAGENIGGWIIPCYIEIGIIFPLDF